METALFWIVWGVVSFWALKTFYFSFSRAKLDGLRKAALGINLAVLVLTFLPWLPPELGGKTGLNFALDGNVLAVLFIIFLIISIVLLLTKTPSNLKTASSATIVNTIILFTLMMQIRPGTFTLSFFDLAPIVAVFFLLVCDVIVLLLWQQLQLKGNKGKRG